MGRFSSDYLELLARKYKEGTLNEQEAKDFASWYSELTVDTAENPDAGTRMKRQIDFQIHGDAVPLYRRRLWRVAAAASFIAILTAGYFITRHPASSDSVLLAKADAAPGRPRAMLTLANGAVIDLDTKQPGTIAGASASKSRGNKLVYQLAGGHIESGYNTLSTPDGGEYEVILGDGTKVWLNAASKLTYPEHFSDTARRVTLEGEAYFEVAHENKRPFRVVAGKQEIQVLGTHFNINAYRDEPRIITTLVQGLVSVRAGGKRAIIKPGQQAMSDLEGQQLTVKPANIATELAWKNGMIIFEDASLPTIMRQAARWYNIKVRFTGGNQTAATYTGGFSRKANLIKLLEILKANHIEFSMKEEAGQHVLEINQ